MKRITLLTFVAAGMAVSAPAARAQGMFEGIQIGGAAGVAIPTSDLGNASNTGYNVTFILGFNPAYSPVGIRLEAAYNEFGLKNSNGNINIPAFTANGVLAIPGYSFTPYVIGGAGLYRTGANIPGFTTQSDNHFGFNVGGGVKVPLSTSFETFVEARWNRVSVQGGSLSFIPITVGILW